MVREGRYTRGIAAVGVDDLVARCCNAVALQQPPELGNFRRSDPGSSRILRTRTPIALRSDAYHQNPGCLDKRRLDGRFSG
jgi:hypothetical protein